MLKSSVLWGMCLLGALGAAGCSDAPAEAEAKGDALPLSLGSQGPRVRFANEHLRAAGYFPDAELAATFPDWRPIIAVAPAAWDVYDESSAAAVRKYQINSGLDITGSLDERTFAALESRNCGVPDTDLSTVSRVPKFDIISSPLTKNALTVKFTNTSATLPPWDASTTWSFIWTGVLGWEAATSKVFSAPAPGVTADFTITVAPLDGPGGLIGQTVGSSLTLDSQDSWNDPALIAGVAMHEVGHFLRINHSGFTSAVMYPAAPARDTLDYDDFVAGNTLYNGWDLMPPPGSGAVDIGVNNNGPDYYIWTVGNEAHPDGGVARRWNVSTQSWTDMGGRGVRVDVSPTGVAWVVTKQGKVQRFNGSWSVQYAGSLAKDIAIAPNGTVYVIGTDGKLYKLLSGNLIAVGNPDASTYIAVDVGPTNEVWITGSNKTWKLSGGTWQLVNGASGRDIAVGGMASNSAYQWAWSTEAVGGAPTVYDRQPGTSFGAPPAVSLNQWIKASGPIDAKALSVTWQGGAYAVDSAGNVRRRSEYAF